MAKKKPLSKKRIVGAIKAADAMTAGKHPDARVDISVRLVHDLIAIAEEHLIWKDGIPDLR